MCPKFTHIFSGMKHKGVVEYKEFIPKLNAVVMEFVELGTLNDYLKEVEEPVGISISKYH